MSGADIALVVGALATLITAVTAAAVVIMKAQQENKLLLLEAQEKIRRVQETADQTHTMVNSQRLSAAKYTKVLVDALRAKGIDVPDDESLE